MLVGHWRGYVLVDQGRGAAEREVREATVGPVGKSSDQHLSVHLPLFWTWAAQIEMAMPSLKQVSIWLVGG